VDDDVGGTLIERLDTHVAKVEKYCKKNGFCFHYNKIAIWT
jgi:hypothetical protein